MNSIDGVLHDTYMLLIYNHITKYHMQMYYYK